MSDRRRLDELRQRREWLTFEMEAFCEGRRKLVDGLMASGVGHATAWAEAHKQLPIERFFALSDEHSAVQEEMTQIIEGLCGR